MKTRSTFNDSVGTARLNGDERNSTLRCIPLSVDIRTQQAQSHAVEAGNQRGKLHSTRLNEPSRVDYMRADRDKIQQALAQKKKEDRRDAIIDSFLKALRHDPRNNGADALQKVIETFMPKSEFIENIYRDADARRLAEIIIEQERQRLEQETQEQQEQEERQPRRP